MDTTWKVSYEETSTVENLRNMPRFGHTNDFAMLFSSSNQDDRSNYSQGLLFGGCFVMSIFIAWTLLLMVFAICLGRNKVGFLSGRPFFHQPHLGKPGGLRVFWCRVVFFFSGITFIVFTLLLITRGITQLQQSITTIGNTGTDIDQTLFDLQEINKSFRDISITSQNLRNVINTTLLLHDDDDNDNEGFCSSIIGRELLLEETGDGLGGFDFDNEIDNTIDLVYDLDDFIDTNLLDVQEGIVKARKVTSNIEERSQNIININDWQSLLIIISFVVLSTLMLVGMILSSFEATIQTYECLLYWIIIPLFAIATIVAYVISSGTMIAAVANADFCSNPDAMVTNMLNAADVSTDDIIQYKAVRYYVSQCDSNVEDPWMFLRDFDVEVDAAATKVHTFNMALENVTIPRLNLICQDEYQPIKSLIDTLDDTLSLLKEHSKSSLELLACRRIVPLYTRTVYTSTCNYNITGITWTFSASLVIAVTGMIMLTLRSVLWDVEVEEVVPSHHHRHHDVKHKKEEGQEEEIVSRERIYEGDQQQGMEQQQDVVDDHHNQNQNKPVVIKEEEDNNKKVDPHHDVDNDSSEFDDQDPMLEA